MLLLTPNQPAVLYVNLHGDSTFTATDRHVFQPSHGAQALAGDQEVVVTLPLPGTVFTGYPIRVIESPARARKGAPATVHELWVRLASAQGTVTLDGRRTLVQFEANPATGKPLPVGSWSVDVSGNGAIEPDSKTENQTPYDLQIPLMFKVGKTYVTPGPVDERAGTFVMHDISASDYIPPLDTGVEVGDIAFGSLDGVAHHLAEYRGKYVMLDFWTMWCGSCISTMPEMEAAYQIYHPRGLEIVSINLEDHLQLDTLRAFLKKHGSTWTHTSVSVQPTGPALHKYVDKYFHIDAFPTAILIGPDGKIAALDEVLSGPVLQQTLERLIPARSH
jgi:thiol-disulfide isomerase/thioredoxin